INDTLGTITGVLTTFPYRKWKREHAIHHASSSNLDKRGIGDIWVMTVEEYANASNWKRITYRFYRNPFIMFGLGPLYLVRSEEHTSELQSRFELVCRLLLEKKNKCISIFHNLSAIKTMSHFNTPMPNE